MLEQKLERLQSILRGCETVCVGYSGGVDSAFLAKVATDALGRDQVLAVTGVSASVPRAQLESARAFARQFHLRHLEVATREFGDPNYTSNPTNRCYYCKSELWRVLRSVAQARGARVLIDGTNADDVWDYRPGAGAGREWGVQSPLLQAELSKQDIRSASRAQGLPTWDQPSAPCLSSRLPYGLSVTPERLQQVEQAEAGLRALGFRQFRVRHHGDAARVEFGSAEFELFVRQARPVEQVLRSAGFERVLIDLEGYRRGALNEGLSLVQLRVGS